MNVLVQDPHGAGKNCRWQEFPGGPMVRTVLSVPRARVRSLVRELRSHKPCGTAKHTHTHTHTHEEQEIGWERKKNRTGNPISVCEDA